MNLAVTIVLAILGSLLFLQLTSWLLHWFRGSTPFLIAPPKSIFWYHVTCVFGKEYKLSNEEKEKYISYRMPLKARIKHLFELIYVTLRVPVFDFFMLIDEILYPQYRQVKLDNSVFLVGAFRTGSTSLHRLLSKDEERFITPKLIEILMPFIWFQCIWEKLQKVFGERFDARVDRSFRKVIGEETYERHPMNVNMADEDDFLLSLFYKVGWYAGTAFPHPGAWMKSGMFYELPEHEREKCLEFYERSMQKILWRRGVRAGHPDRVILSKSHLISLMPGFQRRFPGAKITGLVRHPANTFASWFGLVQVTKGKLISKEVAVNAHLQFWDFFTQEEMKFFGRSADEEESEGREKNKTLITFTEFISDHIDTVERLYLQWGIGPIEGTVFHEKLLGETENHKNYKRIKVYKDLSLEELGLSEEYISDRYVKYIDFFQLQKNTKTNNSQAKYEKLETIDETIKQSDPTSALAFINTNNKCFVEEMSDHELALCSTAEESTSTGWSTSSS